MSAPDTNTRKESERHRGPLTGMFAVVLFALVLLAILTFWVSGRGGDPEGAASSGDSTTAVSEEAAPLVQPEEVTGADPSANEAPDANPSDTQVSTPAGEEPQAEVSADD